MRKKNIDPEFKDVYKINILKFLLVVLIVGAIGFGCYYIYDKELYKVVINFFSLEEEENKPKEEEIKKVIYYYRSGDTIKAVENKSNELELVTSYECKTNNCYSKSVDNKFGIIIDEGTYIYNIDEKKDIAINVDLKHSSDYMFVYSDNKLYGILYKDEKTKYYSIDEGKDVYSSTTWSYYKDSNLANYGYIAFKTKTSTGLLDLNTNKIVEDSIHEGEYTFYEGLAVIKKDDKYHMLDKQLKVLNSEPKYIRFKNAKDYLYLMDGSKNYYKCDVQKVTCSKKTATYAFYDLLNDSFITQSGTKLYFGPNTYTLTKKIESIKDKTYDPNKSFYIYNKDGNREVGYYLAFVKEGETKSYELYYFDNNYAFVSQESIDY